MRSGVGAARNAHRQGQRPQISRIFIHSICKPRFPKTPARASGNFFPGSCLCRYGQRIFS
jgi:hypothetical protein